MFIDPVMHYMTAGKNCVKKVNMTQLDNFFLLLELFECILDYLCLLEIQSFYGDDYFLPLVRNYGSEVEGSIMDL